MNALEVTDVAVSAAWRVFTEYAEAKKMAMYGAGVS